MNLFLPEYNASMTMTCITDLEEGLRNEIFNGCHEKSPKKGNEKEGKHGNSGHIFFFQFNMFHLHLRKSILFHSTS